MKPNYDDDMKRRKNAPRVGALSNPDMDEMHHHILKHAYCLRDYQMDKRLGTGGYGLVYRMIDKYQQHFAVKIQLVEKSFFNELLCMYKFFRYGIGVKFVDYCYVEYDNRLYGIIVMDELQGSLKTLVCGKWLSEDTLQSIGKQMMMIFETMRKYHMSHNDLFLHNIGYMNGNTVELKLFDFGESLYKDGNIDLDVLLFGHELLSTKSENLSWLRTNYWSEMKELLSASSLQAIDDNDPATLMTLYMNLKRQNSSVVIHRANVKAAVEKVCPTIDKLLLKMIVNLMMKDKRDETSDRRVIRQYQQKAENELNDRRELAEQLLARYGITDEETIDALLYHTRNKVCKFKILGKRLKSMLRPNSFVWPTPKRVSIP
jgi:hypothetical protein